MYKTGLGWIFRFFWIYPVEPLMIIQIKAGIDCRPQLLEVAGGARPVWPVRPNNEFRPVGCSPPYTAPAIPIPSRARYLYFPAFSRCRGRI
jgi:hypothetical protein